LGKLKKPGILSDSYGMPKKPPVGAEATCARCRAVTEVEENEPDIQIGLKRIDGSTVVGWTIPCAELYCSRRVFIPWDEMPGHLFMMLNGENVRNLRFKPH
jgi:hypothetical protein